MPSELQKSHLSPLVLGLCAVPQLRSRAIRLACRLEGGAFFSATARQIMSRHFGITIGAYSYGGCFDTDLFLPPVTVGRYVSIAQGVRTLRRNHPHDALSTHPFFFNSRLGYVSEERIPKRSLEIGHDAWVGAQAIVTPGCTRIGIGSIVGAGAVLTRDVPDFAIMGGVPARLIRMRFPEDTCKRILESKWWLHSLDECLVHLKEMTLPIDPANLNHPLLAPPVSG